METTSLKALANKVLQRNKKGNSMEIKSFHTGKPEGLKVSIVSLADTGENFPEIRACHICHEFAWWLSTHGVLVCGVCHPPARPGLVKKWIGEMGKSCKSGQLTKPQGVKA